MTTSSAVFATSRRETMENVLTVPIAEKPNLMELEKDGRRKAGKTEKGRRHAGEAVLRRKLANRAFLVRVERVGKELGTAGGGRAGGRGRGRALSERVAAEFAPSVPYSLNRRSRWAKLSDGDWLSEVASRGDVPRGGRLRLSLAEADYSLDGSESIRALHSLDAERGLLHSRWGKSGRGAASIGDLISPDGGQQQENREPWCDEAVDDVLFQLQRPHPVTKLFAAKFFKRTKSFRSAKRCAVDSAFGGTNTSSEQQQQQQMEKPRKKSVPVPESEPEEESEFVAQYRPRQETYSLADFVKETCSPPVMVRRQPKGLEVPSTEEEQFAIVPMPECMPLMSRSPSADFAVLSLPTLFPRDSLQNRLPSALMPHQGTFLRIPLQADIATLNGLNISKPEWRPIWVDEGTLMFDLTWELFSNRGKEPETPLLVMILDGLELILNTVFPLSDRDKLSKVTSSSELGLGLKLDALLKLIKPNFADWITKSELSRAQLISSTFDAHRSVFHSTQLAVASHPIAVYTILEQQRAEWACEEEQFVRAEELMESSKLEQEQNKEDEHGGGIEEEEEEEFELIDMTELVREDKESEHEAGNTATNLIDLGPQCADCARCPAPRVAMLRSCGHRFCGECIAKSLEEQIKADGRAELRCPVCSARLPLDLLPRFLPLPVANTFALLHFVRHNSLPPPPSVLRPLAQCPGCSGLLLDAGDKLRTHTKIILCSRCSLLWCCHCDSLPHWPLNCAQNVQWTQKFAQHERSQELPEAKNGAISAQFAQIFSEARARRMDLKLGWQLGKCTRRLLGDAKAERRFVGARKTALHLLEFGTAWLYLSRQSPRPPAWSQLRSLLWALRDLTESLNNELLFSGALCDVRGLNDRLVKLERMVDKTQQKFTDEAKEGTNGRTEL